MYDKEQVYQSLRGLMDEQRVLRDEPMKAHTTFRIGGPADLFVMPHSEGEIVSVVGLCREEGIPFTIVGNGSNLLVGDKGYRGVVIQIGRHFAAIVSGQDLYGMKRELKAGEDELDGCLYAKAGAMLIGVSKRAQQEGLAGLAFASGIPGTLGGAVMMNAGAYGGEMKQVVIGVRALTKDGQVKLIPGDEMEFGYRTSIVEREGLIVLGALMKLTREDPALILEEMERLKEQRNLKQPLDKPSAGSTFKRPEGYFAGKLIMDAGLRGFSVGDAQVSEKHCGFVINRGRASAADVVSLMEQVSSSVYEQFGVRLEPEVKRLGDF